MSKERDLLGRWHNGDLLPEEYMALMKETKELLAQPEHKREPLSEEAVSELLMGGFSTHLMDLVRMLEKAHGIGGE